MGRDGLGGGGVGIEERRFPPTRFGREFALVAGFGVVWAREIGSEGGVGPG